MRVLHGVVQMEDCFINLFGVIEKLYVDSRHGKSPALRGGIIYLKLIVIPCFLVKCYINHVLV